MFIGWSLTYLLSIILIFIIVISLILWVRRRATFNRQIIVFTVLAFLAFQTLFFLQGHTGTPTKQGPFENKVLLALGLILTFMALSLFLKWLLIEFLINRFQLKFPTFILDIASVFITLIVVLLVISEIFGVELTGVLVTSTVVSAVIGLSLQSILKNFFDGIVLQMESPFVIGDWVEVAGEEAQVVRQNWRTMSLLTRQNHHLLVTNSDVAQDRIVNFSRPSALQAQDITVPASVHHPPGQVQETFKKMVLGIDGVLLDPPPFVYIESYGDTEIIYRIRFWIDDFGRKVDIHSEVLKQSWYALKRANLALPTPDRNLFVKMLTPEEQAREKAGQKKQIAAVLRPMPFLQDLSDTQIQHLADIAELYDYATGEMLIQQGDEGDSLFIVKTGIIGIYIHKEGRDLRVDERLPLEFLGEMSLLTGAPRTASAVAETETEVIVIGKEPFAELLTADPTVLDLLLNALDKRQANILQHIITDDEVRKKAAAERSLLVNRIKNFLGLS